MGRPITQEKIRELLSRAKKEKFAVPSFNYSDIWDFLAIIEAAEELRAPIFIASNQRVATTIGLELCGALGLAAMDKATIPLIHHLDHCNQPEICCSAVKQKYPSVMIDASMHPLSENIQKVQEVVDCAHPEGVFVEGEVGRIKGLGVEGVYDGDDFLASVDDVVRFWEETKVDMLAVGIGTAHGFYKGKPEIHFDRLKEINEAVSVPLVLHGGTGIAETDIHRAISEGICKINVGTIIHCTYMNNVLKELSRLGENSYTLDVVGPAIAAIREEVGKWIVRCKADHKV
jgi:ketose-bisphosphate aldolase